MVSLCHIQCYALLKCTHSSCLSYSAGFCSDPVNIDNGVVAFTGNSIGDTATYTCNSGFELIGFETTTCSPVPDTNIAFFFPQPPFCRREYCMRVAAQLMYHMH